MLFLVGDCIILCLATRGGISEQLAPPRIFAGKTFSTVGMLARPLAALLKTQAETIARIEEHLPNIERRNSVNTK
jgi:hypothetical protein